MAGPNHRAGFIAAPVKGPPIMMSSAMVSPIARPPTALKEPLGSIPVPYTTETRKNVRMASTRMAVPQPTAEGPERDGRIEMPAGDVRERGRHHADRESVRKGDEQEIRPARGDDRPRADENQRKGADEFRDSLPPRGDRHLAPPPAA